MKSKEGKNKDWGLAALQLLEAEGKLGNFQQKLATIPLDELYGFSSTHLVLFFFPCLFLPSLFLATAASSDASGILPATDPFDTARDEAANLVFDDKDKKDNNDHRRLLQYTFFSSTLFWETKKLTFPPFLRHKQDKKRQSIVICASLVDKAPNLGGLCRTCEIFRADCLVVGDLNVIILSFVPKQKRFVP